MEREHIAILCLVRLENVGACLRSCRLFTGLIASLLWPHTFNPTPLRKQNKN